MAEAAGVSVVIDDETDDVRVDPVTGTVERDQPDGGVVVQLHTRKQKDDDEDEDWFENLADEIDPQKLQVIANDLADAVEADDKSREGYLATLVRGLDLVGLKLENPSSQIGDTTSAVEGMSKVTNPLLLEAILKGWANAQGELLPAGGPMKVMVNGDETGHQDELAEALERDMNHWFTKTASEYYPETSHMLLWGVYFGGSGFKKVYRCPMRRRPVSESVNAKDLIVSDTMKDIKSCTRVTHAIPMRPSVMKRMQFIGAYRDVNLPQPTPVSNVVDEKVQANQGVSPDRARPEDQPYNLWETQCELDIDEFVPDGSQFKGEGIPLPYLVTLDKDSREILSIRRDWEEDDKDCERIQMYVRYPYVPGPGFYGTGLLNILGNSSAAMTAAWREALDAGMYANFPGGLIAKLGARQNTSTFRLSPGEFQPVDTNNMPISQVVMGLPYKDVTPGLLNLIDRITQQAKEVGGTADIPTAEGIQNVPVGTMLAQIEQATKVLSAAHKGMHQAQSEEFDLIIKLFRAHPEDFWRQNKICPENYWHEQKFLEAIGNYNLVPMSDPNIPSHIHRVSKALALAQLAMLPAFAPYTNVKEAYLRILRVIREDPNGLVIDPPPQQAAADPNAMKAQASIMGAQIQLQKLQQDSAFKNQEFTFRAQELAVQKQIADANITRELIIHQSDQAKMARDHERENLGMMFEQRKNYMDNVHRAREHELNQRAQGLEEAKLQHQRQIELHSQVAIQNEQHRAEVEKQQREHHLKAQENDIEAARVAHQMQMERDAHGLAVQQHQAEHQARMQELDRKDREHEHQKKAHEDEMAQRRREAAQKAEADKIAARKPKKAFASGGAVMAEVEEPSMASVLSRITELAARPNSAPQPNDNLLGAALDRLAGAFDRLAEVQRAPREIVRDAEGIPIGVRVGRDRPPPASADAPINVVIEG